MHQNLTFENNLGLHSPRKSEMKKNKTCRKISVLHEISAKNYLHPIVGAGFAVDAPFGSITKTAERKSGTASISRCRSSRLSSGTLTSIINEKYDDDNRPATDSPTFPPCAITKPVTSLTIPKRSNPAALIIKCDVFALVLVENHVAVVDVPEDSVDRTGYRHGRQNVSIRLGKRIAQ